MLNNFQINSFCLYVVCWELTLHYSVCNLEYSHFSHIQAWTHVYHGYWLLQRVETSSHALYIFNCSPGDRMSAYSVSEVPFFFFTLVTITLCQHDKWNIQSCSLIMWAMIILKVVPSSWYYSYLKKLILFLFSPFIVVLNGKKMFWFWLSYSVLVSFACNSMCLSA